METSFALNAGFEFGKQATELDFSHFGSAGTSDGIMTEIARRPVLYDDSVKTADFDVALDFCEAVELKPGARAFAFVSGDFVFGDILEGFATLGTRIESVTIQTLSISAENVDSLVNLTMLCPDIRRIRMVLSTYFWAHEHHPGGIIPYCYAELEPRVPEFDVAFAMIHTKVASFETEDGVKVVIDGSANLRSSKSIEQVRVECDEGLYGFVEDFSDRLFSAYSVINSGRSRPDNTRGGQRKLWEMINHE